MTCHKQYLPTSDYKGDSSKDQAQQQKTYLAFVLNVGRQKYDDKSYANCIEENAWFARVRLIPCHLKVNFEKQTLIIFT